MHRSQSGQATLEYVGVLALLAVLMTLAAVAIAAPDLPETVVAKMRLALCIVGGDVCSASDAREQGLEPCVTGAEAHTEHHGATIGFLHPNKGGAYRIERLSDGRVRISRARDLGLDGVIGAEVDAGPIKVGGSASVGVVFTPGKQWEMSAADYDRLVAASGADDSDYDAFDDVLDHEFPQPTSEFKEFGVRSMASLTAKLDLRDRADYSLGSYDLSSERALGFRDNPDGTSTVYFRVGADVTGPLAPLLPSASTSTLLAEWRTSDPPRLTLRVAQAAAPGQSEEVQMDLDLTTPELRHQALLGMASSPVLAGTMFKGLAGAIRSQGTVQRFRYADHGTSHSVDVGTQIGFLGGGYDKQTSASYRRLIDAEVLKDGVPVTREDCLGTIIGA